MNVDEFIRIERQRLIQFKKWWKDNHLSSPKNFPLEISNDNIGIWDEMLYEFKNIINQKGVK